MIETQQARQPANQPKRASALRDERFQQLMDNCQQEVLRQIIGPFGLTSAMFDDKTGGNVTTTHNFEKGVTATEQDNTRYEKYQKTLNGEYDRSAYNKDIAEKEKRKNLFQKTDAPISSVTGKELPRDGQTHLDHVRSTKRMETDPKANLFMDKAQRVEAANHEDNLVPVEASINQSMQDKDKHEWANAERKKDPGKTNAESFGVDQQLLDKTVKTSDEHINKEIRKAQLKKQGNEVLSSGAKEAGRNALRQAFGVLLHEFANGSFIEIKVLLKERDSEKNLIDRLVESLRRVMGRVINKLKAALEAAIQGGVQGFVSNLLTFLINNLITTSKKIVTIIRESMQGLWKAIKMIVNPPADMSAMDVAREVTKAIAAVVTTGIGLAMEESVKGFVASIPLFVPIADVLAVGVTAIMTGIAGALIIYGIDTLFDSLSSSDTELLAAQAANADAQTQVVGSLEKWLSQQVENSRLYEVCALEYQQVQKTYAVALFQMDVASIDADVSLNTRGAVIDSFETQIERKKRLIEAMKLL